MTKVTLALGSFALGAASMFLLGNHTSTLAHGSTNGQSITGRSPDAVSRNEGLIPIVRPVINVTIHPGVDVSKITLGLDGTSCNGCTLHDLTIEYGGGAYSLVNTKVKLPVNIKLIGAALNTAQFLQSFGLLGCPAKASPQVNPNAPKIMTASLEVEGDFVSAVNGK